MNRNVAMLSPFEFSLGYIGNVTQLTLVLPIDNYDHPCVVTLAPGKPTAIVVDERYSFTSFACEGNTHWKGIVVPNIAIELDETSSYDASGWSPPLGMLVRREDGLFVSTRPDGGSRQNTLVPILTGLPAGEAKMAAGFKKWQIVIGEGLSKRVLMTFDTEQLNKPKG
jgi:hypothetical protein